ncbi:MAG: hypothetical protein IT258_09890 [Saprospiraceae bacterium]|nr:hypothetical protein [Saprospiraceae bacterium]
MASISVKSWMMKKSLQLKNWPYCAKPSMRGRGASLSLLLFCCLSLSIARLEAQSLRDNEWIISTGNEGGTKFDFSTDPVNLTHTNSNMLQFSANASICDTLGNLLFYTNGAYLASANHSLMWNGSGLDLGLLGSSAPEGSNMPQIVMILPLPGKPNIYYVFYKALFELFPDELSSKFYYSKVDISKNQGNGLVVEKNQVILEGEYLDWGKITACRHANGRDWWILLGKADSNTFLRFLFDVDGIHNLGEFEVDSKIRHGLGQAVYSPNGNKYVLLNLLGYELGNDIDIFDFDRCNGFLQNQIKINYQDSAYSGGLAFSPNSRFLYVSSMSYVYQYDFQSANISSSKEIVAVYDGFQNPLKTTFHLPQLAPDGKIYICSGNSTNLLHVINSPNEKGLTCDLQQHSFELPAQTAFSMPNFPNFNLGALEGSPCDTLGVSAVGEVEGRITLKLAPNPAKDFVELEMPSELIEGFFTLRTTTGQVVHTQRLTPGWSVVGLEGIAPGLYFWEVKDDKRVLGTGKLIVVE